MTAVQWLTEKLFNDFGLAFSDNIYAQAKEMEKQQHGKTWDAALDAGQNRAWNVMRAYSDFDDYFAETYGSKGSETTSSQTEISDEEVTYTEKDVRFAYMQGYARGVDGNPNQMESYIEQLKNK